MLIGFGRISEWHELQAWGVSLDFIDQRRRPLLWHPGKELSKKAPDLEKLEGKELDHGSELYGQWMENPRRFLIVHLAADGKAA